MCIIDTLITDRTADDVARVKELKKKILESGIGGLSASEYQEYFSGMKGAYNRTDLNRVGEACNYVYDHIYSLGMRPDGYTQAKTDWAVSDVPKSGDLQTLTRDLSILYNQTGAQVTLPGSFENLTYTGANNIEKFLVEAEAKVKELETSMYFCGEIFCGEVVT